MMMTTIMITQDGSNDDAGNDPPATPVPRRQSTRVTAGKVNPNRYTGSAQYPGYDRMQIPAAAGGSSGNATVMLAAVEEPLTFQEAMKSQQKQQWQMAMDEEIASLAANKTWTLEEPPAGIQPIPVKWVYKVKRNSAGDIDRFKARLVAKGFRSRRE